MTPFCFTQFILAWAERGEQDLYPGEWPDQVGDLKSKESSPKKYPGESIYPYCLTLRSKSSVKFKLQIILLLSDDGGYGNSNRCHGEDEMENNADSSKRKSKRRPTSCISVKKFPPCKQS